jgi:uncharacterized protein
MTATPSTSAPASTSPDVCAPTDWLVAASLTPITDGELAPFYAAAARGELVMPFCGKCEWAALELEQTTCDTCGTQDVQWRALELRGIVHSATTVHRLEPGLVLTTEPYQIIDVEFASTHRLLMTTTEPTAVPFLIDTPVLVGFRTIGGVAVPAVSGLDTAILDPLVEGFVSLGAPAGKSAATVHLLGKDRAVSQTVGTGIPVSNLGPAATAATSSTTRFTAPITISSDQVPGGTK